MVIVYKLNAIDTYYLLGGMNFVFMLLSLMRTGGPAKLQ